MSRYEDPRFRITASWGDLEIDLGEIHTWPPIGFLELPQVEAFGIPELVDGEWLIYPRRNPMDAPEMVDVPEELYLREATDADLRDPRDIVQLAGLGQWLSNEFTPAHEHDVCAQPRDWNRLLTGYRTSLGLAKPRTAPAQIEKRRGLTADAHKSSIEYVQHVDEIGFRVHRLRLAGSLLGDVGTSALHSDSEWWTFVESARAGLTEFQTRIFVAGERGTFGPAPKPTVYNVAWAQIYNDVQSKLSYSTCTNETCGRRYLRQRGRAEYGQHRTVGVVYCSASCARAQAQREYRRRSKQKETP